MSVNCGFYGGHNVYICSIHHQEIPKSDDSITFQGHHEPGKTNDDVKTLQFSHCKMPQLPQSLGETFKNIIKLDITCSNLKSLTKFDLKPFGNLKQIQMFRNDIEFVPSDLFAFTRNIEKIGLCGNNIKFIGPNLLDGLENLKLADFPKNVNIVHYYEAGYCGGYNAVTLEQLKEKIRTACKPPMDESEMLKTYGRDPDEGNPEIQFKDLKI